MIRLGLALLLLGGPAMAETAQLISGEHADFTRLVVELPQPEIWTVGKTAMGYGFAIVGSEQPIYDLERIWDRIPRTRLQSVRIDPKTGALQLALTCDCHVFPFEYRPGVIVLDIKDGPAPAKSAFETRFAPDNAPTDLPASTTAETTATGYDWLSVTASGNAGYPAPALPTLDTGAISLQPLRDELLAQISRGAADGIVEMELPTMRPMGDGAPEQGLPWLQIHIGEAPGIEAAPGGGDAVLKDVAPCLPDDVLALDRWGNGKTTLDLLSEARSGIFAEFDEVDTKATLTAVRSHLYLGFGAEARQYTALLTVPDSPAELPYYQSMTYLVEGESDPQTPFAQMLSCDGAAAFWAALAHDRLPEGDQVNVDAILRTFVALPPHLRQHLGASLADKMLERDDADAARMIRDAMQRAPDVERSDIALMDAKTDLHRGRPDEGQLHAEQALDDAGDATEKLVTLVEAHFQGNRPLSVETADTLQSVLGEREGSPGEPGLRRALVLALALSGQTDAAFDEAQRADAAVADLWQVASQLAADDTFLDHAVLAKTDPAPTVRPDVALGIARRLAVLGFGDAALQWLGPVDGDDTPETRLVAAEAELLRGGARAAVALLEYIHTPEAEQLRARGLVQLGAFGPASDALLAAGAEDEAGRVLAWDGAWPKVSDMATGPWAMAADLAVRPEVADESGRLARGASLVEDSANARAALAALLDGTPTPASGP
jgi:hypothetical protein